MTQNIIIQTLRALFIDLIGEILYFPIWWYSQGLKRTALYTWSSIKNTARNLSLPIMFKSLFKPMFGQYDRQGRVISFFMRILLTISRFVVFIILTIFNILVLIFWILLPVVVAWGLFYNVSLWKQ
ncbi:MAG: hypothetical protein COV55_01665 [Candidatus Komeilibacteria bacterium CG11_big_fil_rev_8_21_14_0_20_36_20]|uniref:Uncharacterized protein n=1 Tax=Candidatus Komeilibacteria bacterium CG11_big_fil_rev_8_21_14_0_20_36_20 TaxID=1974477 RepID=A0A2H0NE07_9BACT|nr:MAG: hypothetical protein COV55_01665 [Candidatus Komeilibacteria bacterium CG11_big_fil_rev_8_21_14_0_20_36_20]PIR81250.1 MAG: hypothetical protein COU21_04650 [Candidatus Komeilibacteria bacterium CG10_big_fil_rev_8_21_14_0_10_36_65]PJC55214.1 MAG: hypothetical protein CO027_03590 [Candidatus Komeilibacteria bacterium CG_4_9_14_0_2_um_filter_36_13]